MKAYLDLMQRILDKGAIREDRTGTGTIGLFGEQLRVDLSAGFPLLTTKKMATRSIVAELLWFLRGDTNAALLRADGCTIWDEWATEDQCAKFGREEDDLGPIYGWAWRHFGSDYETDGADEAEIGGFDQIRWLVDEIKQKPFSRRLIVSAWHPRDAALVALPPCHTLFQCYVSERTDRDPAGRGLYTEKSRYLSLHLYMRSCDYFLGAPFNIASYALLTHLIARDCGLGVGELIVSFGDVHLYKNHVEQAREQISRKPLPPPRLVLASDAPTSILDPAWKKDMVSFCEYNPHPAIKAAVSV